MNLINIANLDIGELLVRLFRPKKIPTVLVVEDNKVVSMCIREAAEAEGFDVMIAASGEEAIGVLHHNGRNYVCAVIDVKLPAMDGWELWEVIKTRWPDMTTRIISIDFDNFRRIPRGVPVTIMVKNGHHYEELFRQLKKELNR